MTRYFFNHSGTPSNLNIELKSFFNYANGEFYDCLRRGVAINAFMGESTLGVRIQCCYLFGVHAETQPGITGDGAELSGFILTDRGSEPGSCPPSKFALKSLRREQYADIFLSSQPWYSTWRKDPLLRMWFLRPTAQRDTRKRWFFFYFIFSFTVVWIFFSAVPYMKLTIILHLNWHLLSVFSTSSWLNRCQWGIAVQ